MWGREGDGGGGGGGGVRGSNAPFTKINLLRQSKVLFREKENTASLFIYRYLQMFIYRYLHFFSRFLL